MPMQKLQFRPGVVRDNTTLTAEGGWFDCDKVRFRSGMPEKIGGWQRDPAMTSEPLLPPNDAAFWGTARWLFDWATLVGMNLTAVGTSSKLYIQNVFGSDTTPIQFNDVTPIQYVAPAGDVTLAATNGSSIITMDTTSASNANVGDFFTIADAVSLGGAITATVLNSEFRVLTVVANLVTFDCGVTANASDTGNGGLLTTVDFQLSIGNEAATPPAGWGVSAWGGGPWGGTFEGFNTLQVRLWSGANYGQDLIACPQYNGLYLWKADPLDPYVFNRAVLLSASSPAPYTTDAQCPSEVSRVMVSDASRFVIALGCTDYVAPLGTGEFDPMLVRWSDQEDYATWAPAVTNQAGSYRLSRGSEIISSLQTRQEILIWTDTAVYSMQFIGPPYTWGFNILDSNISIASMNAVVEASSIVFWMGIDKFYAYTGRVETLPCTIRQYVFGDINLSQKSQFFAGTNEGYHEVWWFYCSLSGGVAIPDRYVIYNYMDKAWSYGTLSRSAWLDTPYRETPIATGFVEESTGVYNGMLVAHETGNDNGETTPATAINAYIQSADFDIGDGGNYAFVDVIIPDLTFDGSNSTAPEVTMTVRPRRNPGSAYGAAPSNPAVDSHNNYQLQSNYTVQRFTDFVYIRVRGRQMAFKVESNTLGTKWQLGVPRINLRPDGRRA